MQKDTYLALMLSAVVCIAFLVPARAQESVRDGAPPSIHAGDWLAVNFRAKIQLDFSGFRPKFDDNRKTFDARRLPFGVDGTVFRDFDYSIRVETRKADPQFRDVFLKYHPLPSFQIQAGRFKIPFSLDQLT